MIFARCNRPIVIKMTWTPNNFLSAWKMNFFAAFVVFCLCFFLIWGLCDILDPLFPVFVGHMTSLLLKSLRKMSNQLGLQ